MERPCIQLFAALAADNTASAAVVRRHHDSTLIGLDQCLSHDMC
jgi:hypothetical protein